VGVGAGVHIDFPGVFDPWIDDSRQLESGVISVVQWRRVYECRNLIWLPQAQFRLSPH
jgi:hypothetical protein